MGFKKMMFKTAILAIAFFSVVSCDDDFDEVGGSLVDGNNFEAELFTQTALTAHSAKITSVQSNGLSSYALGVYKDPKYGRTTANVLTQLRLSPPNPSFGTNPVLDSVVLVVPYFSTLVSQDAYHREYELDSVYGNTPIKLSVYRSGYYLRQYDPNNNYQSQAYYSSQGNEFEQYLVGSPLYVDNSFMPSKQEVVLIEDHGESEVDTTKLSPRLRFRLPTNYFKNLIIDNEGSSQLMSNENFQHFFRGLYFKTELNGAEGVWSLLDFNADEAGVILYYHSEYTNNDGETDYIYSTYKLKFGRQIVNVFDTEYTQLPAQDHNLYLKGGQGSLAVIDLFTDQAQLDSLRYQDWLINEANLIFYVNKDALPANQVSPERVFIYDIKNKKVLKDYVLDGGVKQNDVLNSRTIHLGRLQTDDNGNAYYKIRITNYINDILSKDSTNTKLGLVVSQNVNIDAQSKAEVSDSDVESVPTCEVVARNGTVLYGPAAASDKALKLQIYYTASK